MTIVKLSTEILLWIVTHLEPEDVIEFGKTSHRFRKICEDMILWKELTHQMCLTNKILIPHDLDMLSLKELQHMSTSPSRALKLLRAHRQPEKVDSDDTAKYLVPIRTINVPSATSIDQMLLVPGGRYMVTLAFDVFDFWDLRASPTKPPVSLKQWTHSTDDGVMLSFTPTSDQKGLRIVVSSSIPTASVTVYKLSLSNTGDVSLTALKGPLEGDVDDEDFVCWTLVGDYFAYIFKSDLIIWDYERNQLAKWNTTALGDDCQEIIFHDDRVWLLCHRRLLGWTMPEFKPVETHLDRQAEILLPEFNITIKSPSKAFDVFLQDNEASWISSQDWYSNLGASLNSFDVVWTDKGMDKVTTYALSHIYTAKPPTRPIKPIATLDIPMLSSDTLVPRTVDYTRHCGDSLIKPVYSFRTYCLNLIVSSPSKTKAGGLESFRVALPLDFGSTGKRKRSQEDEGDLFDAMHSQLFDPVAARACRVAEGDATGVLVWDYLSF